MMVEALAMVMDQLNRYIAAEDDAALGASVQAVLGNIAQLDRSEVATELENHIVVTLVKLEEERTLRNGKSVSPAAGGDVVYRNRPLHLNLFILFTANYRIYGTGLKRLAQVMTFFQGKQRFTFANSPGASARGPLTELSLVMDLVSLTFEEINYLWGCLGAKQSPFALYRGRLVALADMPALEGGGVVQELNIVGRGSAS